MLLKGAILINIIVILSLLICFAYSKKQEINHKIKEILGYILGFSTLFYLLFLIAVAVSGLFKQQFITLVLLLFVIAPFPIGHFSRYEKMCKYTMIQLFSFVLSLIFLLLLV